MVDVSAAFRNAVVADARRTEVKAVVEIIDPDVVYQPVRYSGAAPFAVPEQIDGKVELPRHPYATLEQNFWTLDGTHDILDQENIQGDQRWVSDVISGAEETFEADPWIEVPFSGVSILQACSVLFLEDDRYAPPVDYTAAVMVGDTVGWSQRVNNNTALSRYFTGFTVNNPTAVRITIHRTSMPYRRGKVARIVVGIYEEWGNSEIVSLAIKQQGDPSCATLPYGTATMVMDNSNRRFDPGSKAGLFQSLVDRQGIKFYMGVRLPDGTNELAPLGIYYQFQGGWKTGANALSMTWNMVDIIGMVTSRVFNPPAVLPTTLKGWVEAIVGPLGVNFVKRCTVDPSVADTPLTILNLEDIEDITCGELLRYACMMAGAWARAGNDTGDLLVEPFGQGGTDITLDNLTAYPSIQANNDIAAVNITLYDGTDQQKQVVSVEGSQPSSSLVVNVQNPFIHTEAQAKTVAARVLQYYGGNKITTTGRGDPSAEIGDLDVIQINPQRSVKGHRLYQTLNFQKGILSGCQGNFFVPDSFMAE